MKEVVITSLEPEHVHVVYDISKDAFPLPWSKEDLIREIINPMAINLVALIDHEVVGYLQCWFTPYDADLLNIAVKPEYKRQHIGKTLHLELIAMLQEKCVQNLFLEVRVSNLPAQSLYHNLGFITLTKREKYYINGEDAFIMNRQL
ncbi:MAG: ribosomal protein S18-alanine N-acetyltransferase [Clostridium sp.]|nr:ribosomal protein S18-alanine N-acetyltransferase [Clostridium sp.]